MSTGIEWTDETWNPLVGCSMVSPGCAHCYAETMAKRLKAMAEADIKAGKNPGKKRLYLDVINDKGRWTGKVNTDEQALIEPFAWRKPRRIFTNSMSDLFHENVPMEFIAHVFAVMGLASWHTFQVLTKRPERMAALLASEEFAEAVEVASAEISCYADESAQRFGLVDVLARLTTDWRAQDHAALPMGNVWLGTSVENQKAADERIPHLLKCPAAVRFLSAEPLLMPLRLGCYLSNNRTTRCPHSDAAAMPCIDWVIVGGESGPGARPCDVEWIRSIVGQCKAAGVACFVKQLGANVRDRNDAGFMGDPGDAWNISDFMNDIEHNPDGTIDGYQGAPVRIRLQDKKGGEMAEWPEPLRDEGVSESCCRARSGRGGGGMVSLSNTICENLPWLLKPPRGV